jgi:hypothetical protein
LIPDKVKGARKKQAEKKAKKASTAATAIAVDEMMLNMLDSETISIEFSSFNMNDAFNKIPIDEDIVYLKTMFKESDDEESDDGSCDDEKSNDKSNNDNDDDLPILDLSLSAVANVIADTPFTTGAHILESQDIWIADTGALSHVTKHTEGGRKHLQTNVQTHGFEGETIQPDCEMVIPVTYVDVNGTEKLNVVLGVVQTNEKFNYNLFSVTKMLLKGYKLKGDKHLITVWNQTRLIVFDLVIRTKNGAHFCAKFTRNICESEMANSVIQAVESGSKIAKKILKANIKRAHKCFGHMNEIATCKTAAQLGMELSLTGFAMCESCAIGKVQQHNVPKESPGEKATTFNGRVGHDLSKIKVPEGLDVTINKPNWHIAVDQLLIFKQSNFFVTKNEIFDYMCQIMHLEAERGYPIQILHQDNARENVKLVKMAKGKGWKLDFAVEYTAQKHLNRICMWRHHSQLLRHKPEVC